MIIVNCQFAASEPVSNRCSFPRPAVSPVSIGAFCLSDIHNLRSTSSSRISDVILHFAFLVLHFSFFSAMKTPFQSGRYRTWQRSAAVSSISIGAATSPGNLTRRFCRFNR
jgi:hypothetical protein